MSKPKHATRTYFDELDRNDCNPYEIVNIAAQSTRLINDQIRLGIIELKQKPTSEALKKVFDGRVIKLEQEEE